MGIQPIDLQTMYSQLSNVSKVLSTSQQARLTEEMQQQTKINKRIEDTKKVQQASGEKTTSKEINQNGSNSQTFYGEQKQKNKKENNEQNSFYEEKEFDYGRKIHKRDSDYIGTIIDITR